VATIVFVHGTGIRGSEYDETFAKIEEGLEPSKLRWSLQPCCWGDDFGVKLGAGGASIPTYATARAAGVVVEAEDEHLALWASSAITSWSSTRTTWSSSVRSRSAS
jgi:hypothetical protein